MERTLLIAEPMTMVREGLVRLFESVPGYRIVGQCGTGTLAWQSIEALIPNLAILDSNLPNWSPTDILRKTRTMGLPTKTIVVSMRQDRNYMLEVFRAGAEAFVLKTDSSNSILEACNHVVTDTTSRQ
jgi:DNA-binding NarL/FixJ family response regulator